ncbi:MAG TPA: glycosyltransferase 87 family protein [Gaiellaceae bacterium]
MRERASRVALRATVLVTPLLLGALAVPSGGLFRGGKFRDLHLYREYGDALLAGRVPYRDFFVEYPPGAIPLFAAPSLAPRGAYDAIFKVLMTLCCLAAIFCVTFVLVREGAGSLRIVGTAVFLALAPIALGPVSLNTYDAWPAALSAAAVAALVTGRSRLALALLGVAAAAKLYAVLLAPLAVVWIWRTRGARTAATASAAFAAVLAVLVLPWLALSPGGVWDSIHSQIGRALHTESLGASVLLAADRLGLYDATVVRAAPAVSRDLAGGLPDALATVSAVLAVVAALAPGLVVLRRRVEPGLLFAASVAGFLAFTKVLSPQYLVWLIPLAPFGGVVAAVLLVAALALAQSWYFHYHDLWAVGPQAWTLLARNLFLVALFAVLMAELAGRRAPRLARRRAANRGSAAA